MNNGGMFRDSTCLMWSCVTIYLIKLCLFRLSNLVACCILWFSFCEPHFVKSLVPSPYMCVFFHLCNGPNLYATCRYVFSSRFFVFGSGKYIVFLIVCLLKLYHISQKPIRFTVAFLYISVQAGWCHFDDMVINYCEHSR